MQSDKSGELTREEAIRRWKRRQEQDAVLLASYFDLEMVLQRLGEKIREHNRQRTVIAPLYRGKEIIIDKSTQNIVLEARPLVGFRKQHVISFSMITSVVIDYRRKSLGITGRNDVWQISLNTGDIEAPNIKIDYSSEEQYIFDLARAISVLIGKEVRENSIKPDPLMQKLTFDIDHIPKNL